MLSKKMEKALNDQLNAELFSHYLYLSMAACFESVNLKGFARWMVAQSREEYGHAMKLYEHIHSRGGRVVLQKIDAPQGEWDSPLAGFEAALSHEQKITGMINKLAEAAVEEKDYATGVFLQWFINEQIEEEATASDIVAKLKLIGDQQGPLFMMDSHLGARGQ